jgi:hypothetical protein
LEWHTKEHSGSDSVTFDACLAFKVKLMTFEWLGARARRSISYTDSAVRLSLERARDRPLLAQSGHSRKRRCRLSAKRRPSGCALLAGPPVAADMTIAPRYEAPPVAVFSWIA